MAQYNFSRSDRFKRKVEIQKGGLKISLGALILSLLLACLIWLYIEGSGIAAEQEEATTHAPEQVSLWDSGEVAV